MRIFVRNTALDGKPLETDGQEFTGERPLDVVTAMKGATLFSDHGTLREYVDMVLRNAKVLAGLELTVRGESDADLAESLLTTLVEHGLAHVMEQKQVTPPAPEPVPIPEHVYEVLDAIRRSGVTNMLDRPVVIEIARQLGFPEVAEWIERKKHSYSRGIFVGFAPIDDLSAS
jgi:hypothetical protein